MEEDVQYISVFFKNKQASRKAKADEQTIYSEVHIKPEAAPNSAPSNSAPSNSAPSKSAPSKSAPSKSAPSNSAPSKSAPNNSAGADAKPAARVPNPCIVSLLVVSVFVLLGSAAGIIYLSISTANQRSENQRLSSEMSALQEETVMKMSALQKENVMLKGQRASLQNLTYDLSQQTENLNWTLQVILTFSLFPVTNFCPNKQCRPCLSGWLYFEKSCYLFYELDSPWKTWMESQAFCKQKSAFSDLVIINSLQEQKFIHENIKFYYDKFHGYWIGLSQQTDQSWVWVDGREDTLKYWMEPGLGKSGPKALIIPNQNLTKNWDTSDDIFEVKFICESKALIID